MLFGQRRRCFTHRDRPDSERLVTEITHPHHVLREVQKALHASRQAEGRQGRDYLYCLKFALNLISSKQCGDYLYFYYSSNFGLMTITSPSAINLKDVVINQC